MSAVGSRETRSYERLTRSHFARLSELAAADHQRFFAHRPEYRGRLVAITLAQGAALHYLDGRTGVKDFDVWSFFAAIPSTRFPADRRETHADFGLSEFGRQCYDFTSARNQRELGHFRRWDAFTGRRIDLLMRHLPIAPNQSVDDAVAALRAWLTAGAASRARNPPSSWHLARKAMILIDPVDGRGDVVWPLAELDRPKLR
jgi:hypothetical protein